MHFREVSPPLPHGPPNHWRQPPAARTAAIFLISSLSHRSPAVQGVRWPHSDGPRADKPVPPSGDGRQTDGRVIASSPSVVALFFFSRRFFLPIGYAFCSAQGGQVVHRAALPPPRRIDSCSSFGMRFVVVLAHPWDLPPQ